MPVMIAEVYDALREAGASEDKSRKAAEALAGFESRFVKLETDMTVLKWMVGTSMVLLIGGFGTIGVLLKSSPGCPINGHSALFPRPKNTASVPVTFLVGNNRGTTGGRWNES